MAKRKKRAQNQSAVGFEDIVFISNYEITYEPIFDRKYKRLPSHVKDDIDRLYYDSQRKPQAVIPELQALIKKYPKVPMLYNYLSVAYSGIGDIERAEEITKINIQKNPDYLFARLNYAEFFLVRKEYDKVAEIFDNKFDLQLLYPKRRQFHISEVTNFMGFMGVYFLEIGERETAEKMNEFLQEIAPEYPMVKRLKRKLYPNIIRRLMNRLVSV